MASGGLTQVQDGIGKSLNGIISRGRNASAYLTRVVWPAYQQAQIERWESENSSQGAQWKALDRTYAKRKLKKFAAYPGGGNALMVATGRLAQGAQGADSSYFMRTITEQNITVAINISGLPYAVYPGSTRPFMTFNAETLDQWTGGLAQYIMRGDV